MHYYNPYHYNPYYYNPYYQNRINEQQEFSRSAKPLPEAVAINAGEIRGGRAFTSDIRDRQGFEWRITGFDGIVNSSSKVFVSISEIGISGGQVKPFMGAASMQVHNVVPQDDSSVIVRGHIGWESDLQARLSFVVF